MSNHGPANIERMSEFFDRRAEGYDSHMREVLAADFQPFYRAVATPMTPTSERISILDLGCGTGLELEDIFARIPNARVTCIDLSANMLDRLKAKYLGRSHQLTIIHGSYLTTHFSEGKFDYAVSVQAMHHFVKDIKRGLYERIKNALKPGGKYIEGDYVVSPEEEERYLAEYAAKMAGDPSEAIYHVDIPFSVDTQRRLLLEVGFARVDVIFNKERAAVYSAARS
ncbi:MAG: class I SAM-dependent methyltransferase [Firmicutes bacterium]|nr:class I SAM-dependent methyltransferase [Bacillota bacterium]